MDPKNGLAYLEFNVNPYLDILSQNFESADPTLALFGSFLRDIKINGSVEIKDNVYIDQAYLEIPESTISTLLGFLPMQTGEQDTTQQIYSDVTKDAWYFDDINQLSEQIYLDIILDTQMDYETFEINFEPSKEITREEFILMITELLYPEEAYELRIQHESQLQNEENSQETAEVLNEDDYFVDYNDPNKLGFYNVMYAKKIGLVKGDEGKNTLRPDDSLSRAEAITLLARSFDSLKNTQAEDFEIKFEDVPQDAWYIENLKKAVKNEVVKGTSKTTFSPTQKLNRAQASTLLNRLNNQILRLY